MVLNDIFFFVLAAAFIVLTFGLVIYQDYQSANENEVLPIWIVFVCMILSGLSFIFAISLLTKNYKESIRKK